LFDKTTARRPIVAKRRGRDVATREERRGKEERGSGGDGGAGGGRKRRGSKCGGVAHAVGVCQRESGGSGYAADMVFPSLVFSKKN
jgi:hypothetical protein